MIDLVTYINMTLPYYSVQSFLALFFHLNPYIHQFLREYLETLFHSFYLSGISTCVQYVHSSKFFETDRIKGRLHILFIRQKGLCGLQGSKTISKDENIYKSMIKNQTRYILSNLTLRMVKIRNSLSF